MSIKLDLVKMIYEDEELSNKEKINLLEEVKWVNENVLNTVSGYAKKGFQTVTRQGRISKLGKKITSAEARLGKQIGLDAAERETALEKTINAYKIARKKQLARGIAQTGAVAAGVAGVGYGASKLAKKNKQ